MYIIYLNISFVLPSLLTLYLSNPTEIFFFELLVDWLID